MEMEDKQLVQCFLDGSDEAFEKLMKKYLGTIYNFLYQIVRDRDVLDDLTQVTFIKAWKNIKKFDKNRNFRAWLFTIAKNTAYDHLKKKKTLPFSFFLDDEGNNKLENVSGEEISIEDILDQKKLSFQMEEILVKIPEKYQTLLLFHYRDDLALSEIAEIFQRPYNTVKSQHQRALISLKRAIWENTASHNLLGRSK